MSGFASTPSGGTRARLASAPGGRALVVEAMVLLAFLAFSVALIMQVYAAAGSESRDAHEASVAMQIAVSAAERFSAHPVEGTTAEHYDQQGAAVKASQPGWAEARTVVTASPQDGGTLYSATINVERGGAVVYTLHTQRYVPEGGAQ